MDLEWVEYCWTIYCVREMRVICYSVQGLMEVMSVIILKMLESDVNVSCINNSSSP